MKAGIFAILVGVTKTAAGKEEPVWAPFAATGEKTIHRNKQPVQAFTGLALLDAGPVRRSGVLGVELRELTPDELLTAPKKPKKVTS